MFKIKDRKVNLVAKKVSQKLFFGSLFKLFICCNFLYYLFLIEAIAPAKIAIGILYGEQET